MSSHPDINQISDHLFTYPDHNVFAIIDGASANGLQSQLKINPCESCCLFSGELPPELHKAAPFLIKFEHPDPLLAWLLQGWGKHYGIYATVVKTIGFKAVRKHFRTFLLVDAPDQSKMYFRYYDPRILRVYLPTCNPDEAKIVFGPVHSYICEGEQNQVIKFWA